MREIVARVTGDDDAQATTEYALLLALVLVAVVSIMALAPNAARVFSRAAHALAGQAVHH